MKMTEIFLEPPPHNDIPVDRGLLDFLGKKEGYAMTLYEKYTKIHNANFRINSKY